MLNMATTPKDKFDAAVKVIRGLPKNGSFQPSHELMLKFYSYFKQATEGPCRSPKPGFWDVVNRKKWDAWAKLGNMEAEEAMLLYVDELKNVSKHVRTVYYSPEIVETMPQTDDVSEFLQKLDNFYEMVEDSDNHNSLKVYSKQIEAARSKSSDNGNFEQPFDQSLNGSDYESEFEHSQGITKLLQQDLRWWQDRTGVLKTHKSNGDVRHDSRGDESYQPFSGKPDLEHHKASENEEVATGHPALPVVNVSEGETTLPASQSLEDEWEELEARASNSGSHSGQSGGSASDSETENEEEFCDTSDEPAEPVHPQEATAVSQNQAGASPLSAIDTSQASNFTPIVASNLTASSASATSAAKSVHFDERDGPATSQLIALRSSCPPERENLSDSMLVNPSPSTGNALDITTSSLSEATSVYSQTVMQDSLDAGVGTAGRMDISVCRGGDGEDGDRDRQGRAGHSGRGGRDGLSSGRGGGGFSSGGGSSGSRRGLFPEPGGAGGGDRGGPGFGVDDRSPADLNEQIVVTLLRLQHDMSGVLNRLNSLEALVKEGRAEKEKRARSSRGWWPLSELSFKTALIILGWPLLIQIILFYMDRRRRRNLK